MKKLLCVFSAIFLFNLVVSVSAFQNIRKDKKMNADAQKNLKKEEEFLKNNKDAEGVKKTASGLQYLVIKEGSGEIPTATDEVKVNYKGSLIDGTEFDNSYTRGQPAVFPVNRVISGWTEALQLMKVGSKYKLFIPSILGYGANGAGRDIGPNSMLIFEVELLEVVKGNNGGKNNGVARKNLNKEKI
jgi:FKBP-type peptidyl-prolyl cis-trans isomerase